MISVIDQEWLREPDKDEYTCRLQDSNYKWVFWKIRMQGITYRSLDMIQREKYLENEKKLFQDWINKNEASIS